MLDVIVGTLVAAYTDTKGQCAVKLVSNMQYPSQHVPPPQ